MCNSQRKILIRTALRDYNNACCYGDNEQIERAINMMENVFIAVGLWGVEGTELLRQTILAAKGRV